MFISAAVSAVGGIAGYLISSKWNHELTNAIRKASELMIGVSALLFLFATVNENLRASCNTHPTFANCALFMIGSPLLWVISGTGVLAIGYYLSKNYIHSKDGSSTRSGS